MREVNNLALEFFQDKGIPVMFPSAETVTDDNSPVTLEKSAFDYAQDMKSTLKIITGDNS